MRLLIDIESTGFSAKKHSIVEIGWAWADENFGIVLEDQIYILAQEGKEISPEAVDVNGYDEALWLQQGAVSLEEAQWRFQRRLENATQVGLSCVAWAHNATFDRQFVQHYFPGSTPLITEWKCSMAAFKNYYNTKGIEISGTVKDPDTKKVISYGNATLRGCTKTAGVPYERAHGALDDVRSMAKALAWLKQQGALT